MESSSRSAASPHRDAPSGGDRPDAGTRPWLLPLASLTWGVVAVAALGWVVLSLQPGSTRPAWPSVSLGALALLWGLRRGQGPRRRAAVGLAGLVAMGAGVAQIAVLWGTAHVLSYM